MSERAARARRLVNAADAARRADAWIGTAKRRAGIAGAIGEVDAARHGPALLAHARLHRRFHGYAGDLTMAIERRPALGAFLSEPERLRRLALFAGAGLVGRGMIRFVSRRSVSNLVAALGEDVWAYGLEYGAVPLKAARDEDEMIERVAMDGTRAVHSYLEAVAPGLGSDACAAAAMAADRPVPPQEQDTLSAAVDGALEHALP